MDPQAMAMRSSVRLEGEDPLLEDVLFNAVFLPFSDISFGTTTIFCRLLGWLDLNALVSHI